MSSKVCHKHILSYTTGTQYNGHVIFNGDVDKLDMAECGKRIRKNMICLLHYTAFVYIWNRRNRFD